MKTLITSFIASALLASVASAFTFSGFAATGVTIAESSSTFLVSDGGDGFDFDATVAGLTYTDGSSIGTTNDTIFSYSASLNFGSPESPFIAISGNVTASNTTTNLGGGSAFGLLFFDGVSLSSGSLVSSSGQNFGFYTDSTWTIPTADGDTVDWGAGAGQLTQLSGIGTTGSVAVPEPSAYALLGGLFALTCVMLRRRA